MNLLEETIEVMVQHNKTECDVLWVGSGRGEYEIGWNKFKSIADFGYDGGFGGQEIAKDLVVVGKDWWLERHEYDGSEWWEFKTLPLAKENTKCFNKIESSNSWETLSEINNEKEA